MLLASGGGGGVSNLLRASEKSRECCLLVEETLEMARVASCRFRFPFRVNVDIGEEPLEIFESSLSSLLTLEGGFNERELLSGLSGLFGLF